MSGQEYHGLQRWIISLSDLVENDTFEFLKENPKHRSSTMKNNRQRLTVAISQSAPVWLNKSDTLEKIIDQIEQAADAGAQLIAFGEAYLPGYPHWLELTGGAAFNSPLQKAFFERYAANAICIEDGDLEAVCQTAARHAIAVYLGLIERPLGRSGHSLYCSLVYIDTSGEILSVQRKLMPTHEERLVWAIGDGNGLRAHDLHGFRVGGLNCWENWMPLTRAAMYAQGVNVHIAVWPGSRHNTEDISRFIAKESRSYVVSASSIFRKSDIPSDIPAYDEIMEAAKDPLTDGGSCIVSPDGSWLVEPVVGTGKLIVAELDYGTILQERHNYDPSGHYSRPDVLQLRLNPERQSVLKVEPQSGNSD